LQVRKHLLCPVFGDLLDSPVVLCDECLDLVLINTDALIGLIQVSVVIGRDSSQASEDLTLLAEDRLQAENVLDFV